jgi:hypothetical protein
VNWLLATVGGTEDRGTVGWAAPAAGVWSGVIEVAWPSHGWAWGSTVRIKLVHGSSAGPAALARAIQGLSVAGAVVLVSGV